MSDGQLLLVAGLLVTGALVTSSLARRAGVPSLVLFIALGILVGDDGLGWIAVDDYQLFNTIATIALCLILFEGGISTGFGRIRRTLGMVISLAVIATVITAVIAGLAASWLFDLSPVYGLLLGAALAATDGAAVFAVLRRSTLNPDLRHVLEGETGFNNAVAAVLVLGFSEWVLHAEFGALAMVGELAMGLAVGAGVGAALAVAGPRLLRRSGLEAAGLYPVASLAIAAVAYGLADVLHGSGFLSVYIAGLGLGAGAIPAKQTVASFHQGLAWLSQIALFLTLGLLVFPSELVDAALEGAVLAVIVLGVARPVAVWAVTAPSRLRPAERILLGWAGLRGAVPVVLATIPVIGGVPNSERFFNIVFFVALLSLLLQAPSVQPLARRLGLTSGDAPSARPLLELGSVGVIQPDAVVRPVGDAVAPPISADAEPLERR